VRNHTDHWSLLEEVEWFFSATILLPGGSRQRAIRLLERAKMNIGAVILRSMSVFSCRISNKVQSRSHPKLSHLSP
jgi:hypothetical protein